MASVFRSLSLTLFFLLILFANPILSADSPASPPSPSPRAQPRDISPPPATPSPSPALHDSPPAPPTSDPAPNSPSPSPGGDDAAPEHKKSPSPAPAVSGEVSREDQPNAGDLQTKEDSSSGMSGAKKAGVAIGVVGAAVLAGVGVVVYKKRQQNIRRSEYGYAARREFL